MKHEAILQSPKINIRHLSYSYEENVELLYDHKLVELLKISCQNLEKSGKFKSTITGIFGQFWAPVYIVQIC